MSSTVSGGSSDPVLFNKEDVDGGVWDDTALIKAYDEITEKAKRKVLKIAQNITSTKQDQTKKGSSTSSVSNKKWKVGDECMAPYAEDGMWYPATVVAMGRGTCDVRYTDYDGTATVKLEDLQDEEEVEWTDEGGDEEEKSEVSVGGPIEVVDQQQTSVAAEQLQPTTTAEAEQTIATTVIPDIIPPPPPAIFENLCQTSDEKEALTNMLMSWYMSGYHTGYYKGLAKGKASAQPRNSDRKN